MTSHIQIPKPVVVEKQMSEAQAVKPAGLKGLVGKRMSQKTKFMGEEILIYKLSMAEVLAVQEGAKEADVAEKAAKAEGKEVEGNAGLDLIKFVIRAAVDGGADLTDEDFSTFAFDELQKLSEAVLKFSGLGNKDPK